MLIDEIKFEEFGLGLSRKGLSLMVNNPHWRTIFEQIKIRLTKDISHPGLEFFHIGSTAIPQIKAKPILDILGVTPSLQQIDSLRDPFEKLGFTWKGEYGIPGRRYLTLYNKDETMAFVHVHAFEKGHPEIKRHLAFVAYLNKHLEVARRYEALKEELAKKVERADYSSQKSAFIETVLLEALSGS